MIKKWNATIEIGWRTFRFAFKKCSEAEAFIEDFSAHYIPDEDDNKPPRYTIAPEFDTPKEEVTADEE